MIRSFKGRRPQPGQTVKVHRNLADTDGTRVWSILAGHLVVGHADAVILQEVTFRVRPGGHARALRTGQRNVHAYAIGTLAAEGTPVTHTTGVHYNPFRAASFTDDTGETIDTAARVMFAPSGRVWAQ